MARNFLPHEVKQIQKLKKFLSCVFFVVNVVLFFNRPFYRYGGHIELIRFKEYYGVPRGHEHDPLY